MRQSQKVMIRRLEMLYHVLNNVPEQAPVITPRPDGASVAESTTKQVENLAASLVRVTLPRDATEILLTLVASELAIQRRMAMAERASCKEQLKER
jgi:hypothetical protein